jgi:hypothetical protein
MMTVQSNPRSLSFNGKGMYSVLGEPTASMIHTTTCTTVSVNGKEISQHVGVTDAGCEWLDRRVDDTHKGE